MTFRFGWICLVLITGTLAAQAPADSALWQLDLDHVVVTAQYAPTDVRSAIHPVRVLDRKTIDRRFSATLDDVLAYDGAIRLRQDMVLGSALSLQGIDGQGIKILLDGVPVIGRMNGNIDLGQLPLHQIDRIEIVEGPLSVQYGTDALGGVINLITRSSQVRRWETGVRAGYESYGESRLDASAGTWIRPDWMVRVDGGALRFTGWDATNDSRDVLWNPKDQWHAGATIRHDLARRGSLCYRFQWMDEVITNLGEVRRPQFKPYAFDDTYRTRRQDHTLHWNRSWHGDRLASEVIGSYNHWDRIKERVRTDLTDGTDELILGEQDTNDLTACHLRATLASRFPGRWNGMIGTEDRWDIATGDRIIDPNADKAGYSRIEDYAVFGNARFEPTEAFSVESGFRWAWNTRFPSPVVPSVHLRYAPATGWTVRASWARGFRAPTSKELYFEFVDANHFILGNPDLRPETSDNFQASLAWERKAGTANIQVRTSAFYNDVRDKIDIYEFTLENGVRVPTRGDTTTLQYAYFNYDRFRNIGAQVRPVVTWGPWRFQADWMISGTLQPEHDNDPNVPAVTWSNELGWDISWQWPCVQASVSLLGRAYDRIITFYPEPENGQAVVRQRIQDGYTLADLMVGKSFLGNRFRLQAGVKNLLDIRQTGVLDNGASLQHNSGTGTVPVSTGRSWVVGVEWRG